MKIRLLLILIVGVFSCTRNKTADNKTSNQITDDTQQLTQIEFDTEIHDFGKVKSGEILAFSFVCINKGNADLMINKVESDCGCVQVKVPKQMIPPGEKGIIEVEFNSAGMIGKQLKTLEIQSNSKEPKHLIIFAEVENELFEIRN